MEVVEKIENEGVTVKKKRGRKRVNEPKLIEDQKKFFVDYSKEPEKHSLVVKLITEANKVKLKNEVTFKDLVDTALTKLSSKDLEKIREKSMSIEEKLERVSSEYNQKHGTNYSPIEFAAKQLKIC